MIPPDRRSRSNLKRRIGDKPRQANKKLDNLLAVQFLI
jgi:hypothetical protein